MLNTAERWNLIQRHESTQRAKTEAPLISCACDLAAVSKIPNRNWMALR